MRNVAAAVLLFWGTSILAALPSPAATPFNSSPTNPSFPNHPSAQGASADGSAFGPSSSAQPNNDFPLQNLAINSQQFGLDGPLSLGANYSSLTGTFLNGQYVLPLGERWAFVALGEYGADQYRFGGTVGFGLTPLSQLKLSAERLGQRLPFQWNSGTINENVHQDAVGLRYQHLLESRFLQGVNAGAYYATAANESFTPSGGSNYLNIAGAASTGMDVGVDSLLSPSTLAGVKLYYDQVQYSNAFGPTGQNQQGLGAGLRVDQLLVKQLKLFAEASIRPIYDSYQAGLSYLSALKKLPLEFSLSGQHLVSRNNTPDNNSVNFTLNFLPDGNMTYDDRFDWSSKRLPEIADWSKTPAVYMKQVMVTQMGSGGPTELCIGDSYLGGIVYAITGGGTCGTSGYLVSATDDVVSPYAPTPGPGVTWNDGTDVTAAQNGSSDQAGAADTAAIIAAGGCTTTNCAAAVCNAKGAGWYLPATGQLVTVGANLCPTGTSCVGGFSSLYYWSSTQHDSSNAFLESFPSGARFIASKTNTIGVRCVRNF